MIVCSCNVLSDKEVAAAVQGQARVPSLGRVYACLGCRAQCGQCAATIKRIRDDVCASR